MDIRRRNLLKSGLGAAAWFSAAGRLLAKPEKKRTPAPIGFQLYSVRGAFAGDVPGTLAALGEMGYRGVEFWGYGGGPTVFEDWTAERLRKLLDDSGLQCCGMHLRVEALLDDAFGQTVEINKILGNPFLIVAAARERMASPEAIRQFASLLSQRAEKAKGLEMRVGYHCHGFDMERFDGRTGWEILFSQAAPNVIMQLDTGNCVSGGGDPIAILEQFPGRATTLHLKEYPGAAFVPNEPHWKEIFRLCETSHRTEWYIVEQGGPGGTDLDVPRQCFENLRKMGKG
ncbi:MAG: sugar phosphate isomerase/epimerase family protein [Planctomycetota bacterium]|jgi:sugar phosphate isomerase/epimerase